MAAKKDSTGRTKQQALEQARAAGKEKFMWDGVKFGTKRSPSSKAGHNIPKSMSYNVKDGYTYKKKSSAGSKSSKAKKTK